MLTTGEMAANSCSQSVSKTRIYLEYVQRSVHGPLDLIHEGFADQITMYIAIVVAAMRISTSTRFANRRLKKSEFQRALAASELQGACEKDFCQFSTAL